VKIICNPQGPLKSHFAFRKDVERAFGVLQDHFSLIQYPALICTQEQMWDVMHACVIMHNMSSRVRGDPAARDDQLYDFEGPLGVVDHPCKIF
jgi:hypothetical protein